MFYVALYVKFAFFQHKVFKEGLFFICMEYVNSCSGSEYKSGGIEMQCRRTCAMYGKCSCGRQ